MDVTCSVEAGKIVLQIPIYRWINHYPNCIGESDRWNAETIGYHTVRFSPETREIKIDA